MSTVNPHPAGCSDASSNELPEPTLEDLAAIAMAILSEESHVPVTSTFWSRWRRQAALEACGLGESGAANGLRPGGWSPTLGHDAAYATIDGLEG